MSEEDKIYAFVAFGVESYKQANGLSGAEAAQTFAFTRIGRSDS